MHFLIIYQWKTPDGKWILENEAYQGSPTEWLLEVLSASETHKLLNALEITEEEFGDLKGRIN